MSVEALAGAPGPTLAERLNTVVRPGSGPRCWCPQWVILSSGRLRARCPGVCTPADTAGCVWRTWPAGNRPVARTGGSGRRPRIPR